VFFRQLPRDFETSINSLLVCPVASGRFVPDAGNPTLKLPPTVQYCAEIDVHSPKEDCTGIDITRLPASSDSNDGCSMERLWRGYGTRNANFLCVPDCSHTTAWIRLSYVTFCLFYPWVAWVALPYGFRKSRNGQPVNREARDAFAVIVSILVQIRETP